MTKNKRLNKEVSRLQHTIRNANTATVFLVLKLTVTFFSRKVLIDYLGSDLVGMNSTMVNILGFLNLAELGITTVISASLYKPLYTGDRSAITDIVSIFGVLFRRIGFTILILGSGVSVFLPMIFHDSGVSLGYVYAGFFTYLFASLLGYFFNYKQNILDADQKNYLITVINNSVFILKSILQIIFLKYYHGGYFTWVTLEVVSALAIAIWINITVNKRYPWLHPSYSKGKRVQAIYPAIFKNIRQIIPHKFAGYVLSQTSSLIIFAFAGLTMVTIYTNYTTVTLSAVLLLTTIANGLSASVGNLISEGNNARIKQVFWELQALFFFLGGILFISLYYLLDPFIVLWVGPQFLMDRVALYALLYLMAINVFSNATAAFLTGYILYSDTWAPWTEAVLNLGLSIVLCGYYGIDGVILGAAISRTLIIIIWKPYFLYRVKFKQTVWTYWSVVTKYLLAFLITWGIIEGVIRVDWLPRFTGFVNWGINALIITVLSSIILFTFLCFSDKSMRYLFCRVIQTITRR